MVSPLQGRELGHAIASEWLSPRVVASIALIRDAPAIPYDYVESVPMEFPVSHDGTLCYGRSDGRWHRLPDRAWQKMQPAASLDVLCREAHARNELAALTNLTDLNRLCDDETLLPHHRECAEAQYERVQKAEDEQLRREWRQSHEHVVKKRCPSRSVWVQCDKCLRWRRLAIAPALADRLPERWTCDDNPTEPFNRCETPEEPWDDSEEADWREVEEPFTAENDRWVLAAADKLGSVEGWEQMLKCQQTRAMMSQPFSPLAHDYFFMSRTADELRQRVEQLRVKRGTHNTCFAVNSLPSSSLSSPQSVLSASHFARAGGKTTFAAVAARLAAQQRANCHPSSVAASIRHSGHNAHHWRLPVQYGHHAHGAASTSEDNEQDEAPVVGILNHHIYGGAKEGSLYNVYVRLWYADGTLKGGGFEPAEKLCTLVEGPSVLVEYCKSKKGSKIAKYVPSYVFDTDRKIGHAEQEFMRSVDERRARV